MFYEKMKRLGGRRTIGINESDEIAVIFQCNFESFNDCVSFSSLNEIEIVNRAMRAHDFFYDVFRAIFRSIDDNDDFIVQCSFFLESIKIYPIALECWLNAIFLVMRRNDEREF